MSHCTHNDGRPELAPCKNEAVRDGGYCVEHGCCLCGGVMLADTEDWKVHLCVKHFDFFVEDPSSGYLQPSVAEELKLLVDAAYQAGRKSVIGDLDDEED
jgi:hypothetical protein